MKTEHDSKQAPAQVSERRRSPRYWLSVLLTIRAADGSAMQGLSVEISEGGMSAMASAPLNVGDAVELEPVEGGRVSAVVRHKLGQMYGFEFVELSGEQAQRIAERCTEFGTKRVSATKR
jgi:c-di-GMP-binding flagellar brake protein YcgR